MGTKNSINRNVVVSNVIYDGEDVSALPTRLVISVPNSITDKEEIFEFISDAISDITGFCHKGFETNLD